MMGVLASPTLKFHLNALRGDRFRLIATVPYVVIRVPLAANSSYSLLFTGPCNLLRGNTQISVPVSIR